jgi:hypothetical protein
MSRHSGKERSRTRRTKPTLNQAACRLNRRESETRQSGGVVRNAKRTQYIDIQPIPGFKQRQHKPAIALPVRSKIGSGSVNRSLQYNSRAVIERMRERSGRLYPFEAMLIKRKRAEERRTDRERIYRRAYVMYEAWERELGGTDTTADGFTSFIYRHGPAVLRHSDGGGKTVRSGTDNYRIVAFIHARENTDSLL